MKEYIISILIAKIPLNTISVKCFYLFDSKHPVDLEKKLLVFFFLFFWTIVSLQKNVLLKFKRSSHGVQQPLYSVVAAFKNS